MSPTGQYEKFLRNEPLTEELERLRAGEDVETNVAPPVFVTGSGELTNDDREHLRRLKYDAGWIVLLRLLEQSIKSEEAGAAALSLHDPLGNKDAVAEAWAYVSMMKVVRAKLLVNIDTEVRKLEESQERGQE